MVAMRVHPLPGNRYILYNTIFNLYSQREKMKFRGIYS